MSQLKSHTKGLLARWYLHLSRFIPLMKLEYKPGRANVVADSLSKAQEPCAGEVQLVSSENTENPVLANSVGVVTFKKYLVTYYSLL